MSNHEVHYCGFIRKSSKPASASVKSRVFRKLVWSPKLEPNADEKKQSTISNFVVLILLCLAAPMAHGEITIAIVTDGDSEAVNIIAEQIQSQVSVLASGGPQVSFPASSTINGRWSREIIKTQLQQVLSDSSIDLVVALGVIASDLVSEIEPTKPVIAPFVIDAVLQGFPITDDGTSGVENLHYLATSRDLPSEIVRFASATQASKIAIVGEKLLTEALPFSENWISEQFAPLGIDIQLITVGETVSETLSRLAPDADAVFFLPLFQAPLQDQRDLIAAVNSRSLPSFTSVGKVLVEEGALMGASVVPPLDRVARQIALDINDIRLGRGADTIKVSFETDERLLINLRTARAIGFSPPFELLYEADVLHQNDSEGREITLIGVVLEALARNLQLAIAERDLLLARQTTRIARSGLLPQITIGANEQAFDRRLVGVGADRTSTATLGLSQVLYSENTRADYSVARSLQESEIATRDGVLLDTIQRAAATYLDILVAQNQLSIQRDNLSLTRANLRRAKFRFNNGATDRSEVYRFETELANNRQDVANAEASFLQIRNELNRLLQLPIDTPIKLTNANLSDFRIYGDPRLDEFVSTPRQADILRAFIATEAIANAPEVVSIDRRIDAQQRSLTATKRIRYIPDVTLSSEFSEIFNDSGSLVEQEQIEGWSVGVQFSLPLFQGRRLDAERAQAAIELERLELERLQLVDQIEANTRSAVLQASASKRNIRFANDAAVASSKTLELIVDAYTRGAAADIDVIDAQNAALTAQLSSANANYQFLLDLVDVQRQAGFFAFFANRSTQDDWFRRLDTFSKKSQVGADQ